MSQPADLAYLLLTVLLHMQVGALTIADLRKMEEESAGPHNISGGTEVVRPEVPK